MCTQATGNGKKKEILDKKDTGDHTNEINNKTQDITGIETLVLHNHHHHSEASLWTSRHSGDFIWTAVIYLYIRIKSMPVGHISNIPSSVRICKYRTSVNRLGRQVELLPTIPGIRTFQVQPLCWLLPTYIYQTAALLLKA